MILEGAKVGQNERGLPGKLKAGGVLAMGIKNWGKVLPPPMIYTGLEAEAAPAKEETMYTILQMRYVRAEGTEQEAL